MLSACFVVIKVEVCLSIRSPFTAMFSLSNLNAEGTVASFSCSTDHSSRKLLKAQTQTCSNNKCIKKKWSEYIVGYAGNQPQWREAMFTAAGWVSLEPMKAVCGLSEKSHWVCGTKLMSCVCEVHSKTYDWKKSHYW